MSAAENTAQLHRLIADVFNAHRIDRADAFSQPDYVEHVPLPPGTPSGMAGFHAFWSALFAAFPDFGYTVDDVVAEDDRVAARLTAQGTHQGAFLGMPATEQHAMWTELHIARYAEGKIAEHWANIDQLSLLQQLGVIPAPGSPA